MLEAPTQPQEVPDVEMEEAKNGEDQEAATEPGPSRGAVANAPTKPRTITKRRRR